MTDFRTVMEGLSLSWVGIQELQEIGQNLPLAPQWETRGRTHPARPRPCCQSFPTAPRTRLMDEQGSLKAICAFKMSHKSLVGVIGGLVSPCQGSQLVQAAHKTKTTFRAWLNRSTGRQCHGKRQPQKAAHFFLQERPESRKGR